MKTDLSLKNKINKSIKSYPGDKDHKAVCVSDKLFYEVESRII